MVHAKVDLAGVYALAASIPPVRVDQAGIYALGKTAPPVRVDLGGIYAFVAITPAVPIAQAGVYALADGSLCGTRWAQIWTITRNDGVVLRFTSLDRELIWGGETYQACATLNPSAAENVGQVDSAGSMDLSGALAAGGVSGWDLYAGLFDGAEVEALLVPWDGAGRPRRLLKGTFGAVELGETGFKVELIGDGARLQQTPLVHPLQPGCRWQFGDAGCGKDLGPLTVTGTVDSGDGLRAFADAARTETAGYFTRGEVTFTSGSNAGVNAEIKEHEAGGMFTLWPRLPFPIAAGDAYAMVPGCTNIKASVGGCNGCTAWGQLVRYGGFDKVPGRDKVGKGATTRAPT